MTSHASETDAGNDLFRGPLYIVGFPRSGTKLLRDLVNRHAGISLPAEENHFIPHLVRKYDVPLDLGTPERLRGFVDDVNHSSFARAMERLDHAPLTPEWLADRSDLRDWNGALEGVQRFFAEDGERADVIWGDKTPFYMRCMPLLKRLSPAARFVHIIRDPRDVCVSQRRIWHKSYPRTAARWCEWLDEAHRDSPELGNAYLEVRYETLLDDPESTLGAICRFLDQPFDPAMLSLDRASEDYGYAAGQERIVRTNAGRYRENLTERELRRIEEIAYPLLQRLDYPIEAADRHRPLGSLARRVYRVRDTWGVARHHLRRHGWVDGLRNLARLRREGV